MVPEFTRLVASVTDVAPSVGGSLEKANKSRWATAQR